MCIRDRLPLDRRTGPSTSSHWWTNPYNAGTDPNISNMSRRHLRVLTKPREYNKVNQLGQYFQEIWQWRNSTSTLSFETISNNNNDTENVKLQALVYDIRAGKRCSECERTYNKRPSMSWFLNFYSKFSPIGALGLCQGLPGRLDSHDTQSDR